MNLFEIKLKNNKKYSFEYSINNVSEILFIKIYLDNKILNIETVKKVRINVSEFFKELLEKEKKNAKLYIIEYVSGNSKKLVVNMGYRYDRADVLSSYILSNINFNFIYVGVFTKNWFYQNIINNKIKAPEFCVKYVKYFIKKHNILSKDVLFTGLSSGGYCAIYLTLFFDKSNCIVFNPGVHNFRKTKFIGVNNAFEWSYTVSDDLINLLKKGNYTSNINIIVSNKNTNSQYYNLYQTGSIATFKNVRVAIVNCDKHSFFYCYKMYTFVDFLNNYYTKHNINPLNVFDIMFKYLKKV